jgi:hypothetical protein
MPAQQLASRLLVRSIERPAAACIAVVLLLRLLERQVFVESGNEAETLSELDRVAEALLWIKDLRVIVVLVLDRYGACSSCCGCLYCEPFPCGSSDGSVMDQYGTHRCTVPCRCVSDHQHCVLLCGCVSLD